jgi:hypothetical protein
LLPVTSPDAGISGQGKALVGAVLQFGKLRETVEQHHRQRTRPNGFDSEWCPLQAGFLHQSPVQACHHGDQPSTIICPDNPDNLWDNLEVA